MLPCRWFHYLQIIVINIKSHLLTAISVTHPVSYLSETSRAADILRHISSHVEIQRVHWCSVKDEPRFSDIQISCQYFYWDAYWLCNHLTNLVLHQFIASVIRDSADTDSPFVTIIFTFLLLPSDSTLLSGIFWTSISIFPFHFLFSYLSSKLLLLRYWPSCTLLSCGITFSVFLLCHLQVPKASLPYPHIRHWYLILLCVS